MSVVRITEKKTIKIIQGCLDNTVCLRWFNTEGGEQIWVFSFTQTNGLESLAGGMITRNIQDLETATEDRGFYKKTANPQMILGANNLDADDISLLKTLLYSTSVQMLHDITLNQWKTVLVVPGSFSLDETKNERHKLELTISLPQINTQTQ